MEEQDASESFIDWPKTQPSMELLIFPPVNHENLHIPHQSQSSSSTSHCFSSSSLSSSLFDDNEYDPESFSPSDETETTGDDEGDHKKSSVCSLGGDGRTVLLLPNLFSRWLRVGNEVLCSGVLRIGSLLKIRDAVCGKVLSLGFVAVLALIVSLLHHRRRRREGRFNQLMTILNQRDERILLLLQQIARTNEILVARHRVARSESG